MTSVAASSPVAGAGAEASVLVGVGCCAGCPGLASSAGLFLLNDAVRQQYVDLLVGVDRVRAPGFRCCKSTQTSSWIHHSPVSCAAGEEKVLDGAAAHRQVLLHPGVVLRVCPVGDMVGFWAAHVLNIARQGSDHHQVAAIGGLPER